MSENKEATNVAVVSVNSADLPATIQFTHEPENGKRVKSAFHVHGNAWAHLISVPGKDGKPTWSYKATGRLDKVTRVSICPKGKQNLTIREPNGEIFIKIPDEAESSAVVEWFMRHLNAVASSFYEDLSFSNPRLNR